MTRLKSVAKTGGLVQRKPSFESLRRRLEADLKTASTARYRIGASLVAVRDFKLYQEAGFDGFGAFLDSLQGASSRTLYRYMELARKVSVEVALAFETERLEAGLLLLPAKEATPVTVGSLKAIQVTVERDGRLRRVRFDDATTDELVAAVRAQELARRPALPPEATSVQARLQQRLDVGPGGLGDVGLRRRGKRLVLVVEVPLERGEELISRLR